MFWVYFSLIWVALAIPAAVIIGRGIKLADLWRRRPTYSVKATPEQMEHYRELGRRR